MDTSPLISYFLKYWPLTAEAVAGLNEKLTERTLKRREHLLKAGNRCEYITFVIAGCLRMYKTVDAGDQYNLQFATENNWMSDYGSFYSEKPAELSIQALEPSRILQIKNTDLFYLYDHHPMFDRNFRIITENAFIELQDRVLQNISSTAEERYLYFTKRYPQLTNRISNIQIASYIGVTPEFLSVIRRKIAGQ